MLVRISSTLHINYGQTATLLRRLQSRQLPVFLFEDFADLAEWPFADARIAAQLQQAAESNQMESARPRPMLLGVLQGMGVYGQQMHGSERGIRVLPRADSIEDSPAALEIVRRDRPAHRTDS